jgi:hypothetical protein
MRDVLCSDSLGATNSSGTASIIQHAEILQSAERYCPDTVLNSQARRFGLRAALATWRKACQPT